MSKSTAVPHNQTGTAVSSGRVPGFIFANVIVEPKTSKYSNFTGVETSFTQLRQLKTTHYAFCHAPSFVFVLNIGTMRKAEIRGYGSSLSKPELP